MCALLRSMLVNLHSNEMNTTNNRSIVNIILLDLRLFIIFAEDICSAKNDMGGIP